MHEGRREGASLTLDLVIRNGINDTTGEPIEVGIESGVITAVSQSDLPPAIQEIDAQGE